MRAKADLCQGRLRRRRAGAGFRAAGPRDRTGGRASSGAACCAGTRDGDSGRQRGRNRNGTDPDAESVTVADTGPVAGPPIPPPRRPDRHRGRNRNGLPPLPRQ